MIDRYKDEINYLNQETFNYVIENKELKEEIMELHLEIERFIDNEDTIKELEAKLESIHGCIQDLFLTADLCQTDEAKLKFWETMLSELEYLEWYTND